MQNTIYDYFRNECGTVVEEVSNSEYKETYENSPRGNSKKHCPNSNQIKEVNLKFDMFLIWFKKKYKKKQRNVINHDKKLSKKFCNYRKDIIEKDYKHYQ